MKNLKYLFILIIIFFLFIINLNSKKITYNYVLEPRCIYNIEKFNKIKEEKKVLDKFIGTITGYGPDCYGCIGITSSGYDVRNTIYYNDKTYNNLKRAILKVIKHMKETLFRNVNFQKLIVDVLRDFKVNEENGIISFYCLTMI